MLKENQNKINTIINSVMDNLSTMIDANTVIGSPIKTEDGETIIPVSKITLGILSGGGEYGKVNIFKSSSDLPFSVGNGTVVSLKPCAFLIKEKNSGYKLVSVEKEGYEKIIDKALDVFSNVKDALNEKID